MSKILKPIEPYVKFATQMRESSPVLAFYCKMFAVKNGNKLIKEDPNSGQAEKDWLMKSL